MAKKKKNNQSLVFILKIISLVCALVAIVLIFAPHIGIKDTDTAYNGIKCVFGYKKTSKALGVSVTTEYFKFSFMNLVPYLCLIVGVVLFFVFNILGKKNKAAKFIVATIFVVSGVLFFFNIKFLIINEESIATIFLTKDSFELLYGAYLAGACGICSGISLLLSMLFE